jgi:membrane protease YdiL (CAAX protease family)
MSTSSAIAPAVEVKAAVAPWWHTAVVLLVLLAVSVRGAQQNGLPHMSFPGMSVRLSAYLIAFAQEWLIVGFIWFAIRRRGLSLASLVMGRWQNAGAFFKDLGLAAGFLLIGIPLTSVMGHLLKVSYDPKSILPTTPFELIVWVLLSATAGFCEELIFRGYFTRQFAAWTKSTVAAVGLQGLVFGLAHGYQGRFFIVIVVYGCMLGAFAVWRKSLRPGMLAHGLQDTVGGVVGYFTR